MLTKQYVMSMYMFIFNENKRVYILDNQTQNPHSECLVGKYNTIQQKVSYFHFPYIKVCFSFVTK